MDCKVGDDGISRVEDQQQLVEIRHLEIKYGMAPSAFGSLGRYSCRVCKRHETSSVELQFVARWNAPILDDLGFRYSVH